MSEATFTFRVDDALKSEFAQAAKARDRTGAQLLRDFMRDFVRQQQEAAEHDVWLRRQVQMGWIRPMPVSCSAAKRSKPKPPHGALKCAASWTAPRRETGLDASCAERPPSHPQLYRSGQSHCHPGAG